MKCQSSSASENDHGQHDFRMLCIHSELWQRTRRPWRVQGLRGVKCNRIVDIDHPDWSRPGPLPAHLPPQRLCPYNRHITIGSASSIADTFLLAKCLYFAILGAERYVLQDVKAAAVLMTATVLQTWPESFFVSLYYTSSWNYFRGKFSLVSRGELLAATESR